MRWWILLLGIVACVGCRQKASSDGGSALAPAASASAPPSASVASSAMAPSVASAPPAPRSCQKGREFDVDLARWKSKLEAARTPKDRDSVLAELGFEGIEDDKGASIAAERVALRIEEAALASDATADRVVTVRYAREDDNESGGAVRIAILKRLPNGHFCSIGTDFEVNQNHAASACLGPRADELPPIDVTLVHLTSAKRHTLLVARQNGMCGGCGRGGNYEVEFFDLIGFSLSSLFEHTLYTTYYSGCPYPPVQETFGSFELEGPFPRKIVSVTKVVCHTPDPDLPAQYRASCTPSHTSTTFGFLGGKYVASKASSTAPPRPNELALEDLTFTDTKNGEGWGNRCYKRFKEHRLPEARAACERGLASSPSKFVEGAIHFNLALIAEEDGDAKLACAELAKSLRARPNNGATKNRRAQLACP